MSHSVCFIVSGEPRPKQSYRALKRGGGYQPERVKNWQDHVAYRAREAMQGDAPIDGPVAMRLTFTLSNRRRVDCDNLNKAVMDAMRGIVYGDDTQVTDLHITKRIGTNPGVQVQVFAADHLPGEGV